jgi:Flp pilus assembly pilin Flp
VVEFVKEEEGLELVEWALVGALIVVAAAGTWSGVGGEVVRKLVRVLAVLNL